ncbi:DUF3857 domain-containing protein [Flavobacterium sp. SUN046]|uniref:DUF3857 domain-containing protein n=1 Tax=Flavobacterium sp. SUN046 TaxID=3002440 RepID=UPI002DBEFAB5|nr:DUF3857 domain-containing protein [Flavobacterium sp. SUN046]MEC4049235.1 DUF3857 domain-containing protein [Flavobacterium sp. SUN046]
MKKNILLQLLFILVCSTLSAQKLELGKVSIEELKEKTHPKDSSAVAAILFNKGTTSFIYNENDGFLINTDVEMKIKIYKKEGYEWANKSIPFYVGGTEKETVSISKAITYNLVNGQIEKTKLKGEGEFIENFNKLWAQKKITMPNIKEGCIIEYKYSIRSPYLSSFPDWEFQESIPVNYSEYNTYIPEYFFYNIHNKGYLTPKVTQTSNLKTLLLSNKKLVQTGVMVKYDTSTETVSYSENQTTYILEDIPALKDEAFTNNIKNYATSIEHELSGEKMPRSNYKSYANNWEDITKYIYEHDDFGSQIKKEAYFEDDLKPLLTKNTSREERINTVFQYAKSRMNWNGNNGYLCDSGVKKAYQEKTGNIADINLMLVAMLRYAGIDANPILISTRSNGIALFPSKNAFNYVIAAVETENDIILLDASSKNTFLNILPTRALNWTGRIIRKDGSSTPVDLTPKIISKETINAMINIDKQGKIEGKIREQNSDYLGFSYREKNTKIDRESYLESSEKRHDNIEISDFTLTNIDSLQNPVIENYSFKSNNSIEIIGDKLIFSPMFFFAESENPFKREKREYPIDFVYPFEQKYVFSIKIPEEYSIESSPKSASLSMSENRASLKYIINTTEKQIQISVTMSINTSLFTAEEYEELKTFFGEVIKKENEKIILKKI